MSFGSEEDDVKASWRALANDDESVPVSLWQTFTAQHVSALVDLQLFDGAGTSNQCLATLPAGCLLRSLGDVVEAHLWCGSCF